MWRSDASGCLSDALGPKVARCLPAPYSGYNASHNPAQSSIAHCQEAISLRSTVNKGGFCFVHCDPWLRSLWLSDEGPGQMSPHKSPSQ
ncbi:hypothetical protein HJFPF1_01310 [Paramyrothecium foliicola]|nr:hypothetical protein HJFPF1_01310 [Paramyrothecium foliicola]